MRTPAATILLFVVPFSAAVIAQDEQLRRAAYVAPQQASVNDPDLVKFSPELAAIIASEISFMGQQSDGAVIVDGPKEKLEQIPGGVRAPMPGEKPDPRSTELIVSYAPGKTPSEESLNAAGFRLLETNSVGNFVVIVPLPPNEIPNKAARAPGIQPVEFSTLKNVPQVEYIERNVIFSVPEDELNPIPVPAEDLTFNSNSAASELRVVPGIQRTGADRVPSFRDRSDVIVAVIDSGVDYSHSDLRENMWVNTAELNGQRGVDDDGNGVVDDIHGARIMNHRISGDPRDDNGHGTHCAGTIAAVANGTGVIGMSQAKIMALKFLDRNGQSGALSDSIKCIDYARQNGAHIMSNSWGSASRVPPALEAAIARAESAGILFVAAAGNNNRSVDATPYSPINSQRSNVLGVGSVTFSGQRSRFSNFGIRNVDIAAAGGIGGSGRQGNILSTSLNNGYAYLAGTSMAAPHVSGAAALLLGTPQFRNARHAQLKQALLNNAKRNSLISNVFQGGRELDVRFLGSESVGSSTDSQSDDEDRSEFYYATSKQFTSKSNLLVRQVKLSRNALVTVHAGSSASGVNSPQTIATGISIGELNLPSSHRVFSSDGSNDYVSFTTNLTIELAPGTHEFKWWIRSANGEPVSIRGGGSLSIQAFATAPE